MSRVREDYNDRKGGKKTSRVQGETLRVPCLYIAISGGWSPSLRAGTRIGPSSGLLENNAIKMNWRTASLVIDGYSVVLICLLPFAKLIDWSCTGRGAALNKLPLMQGTSN